MVKAGIKKARQHFTEYLSKVQRGEEIIITKREEPIAKIIPIKKGKKGRLVSHKALRDAMMPEGPSLSEIVVKARRKERY